jgi:hypothetical protein
MQISIISKLNHNQAHVWASNCAVCETQIKLITSIFSVLGKYVGKSNEMWEWLCIWLFPKTNEWKII